MLKEASPQAVLITRGNKTETSSSSPAEDDSNLPDLAHLVLADEDMERDNYMTATEAVNYGLADEIVYER